MRLTRTGTDPSWPIGSFAGTSVIGMASSTNSFWMFFGVWGGGKGDKFGYYGLSSVGLVPPSTIPEPTTLALMTLGIAGIGYSRKRK